MTVLVATLVGYLALVMPTPTRMRYLGMFIVRLLIQCVMLPVRLYCMVLNVFFWQWVVVLWMRVARQFLTIHCNPFKCLVPARISANRSLGQFALIDGVISSTRVWETLPTGVCLILPARFRVNTALEWVNPSPTHVWVNYEVISSACVGKTVPTSVRVFLPARFQVNTAPEWVNPSPNYFRVNYHIDKVISSACVGKTMPISAWVILSACFQVNTALECMEVPTAPVRDIVFAHAWLNGLTVHGQVNGFVARTGIVECMDLCTADANVQMKELPLCDLICLCNYYPILYLSQEHPTYIELPDVIWGAPTMKYDIMDYPFFIFHSRQYHFLSFDQTLKMYAYHLSQYWLVRVVEFMMHWSNHLCRFLLQNMTLLVNFDSTPQQLCKRAYLTMCRSQYYKHDFAVVSSAITFSTNIVAAAFVKYADNILCQIFRYKYIYTLFAKSGSKGYSTNHIHSDFIFTEDSVPNKIGGGHQKICVKKMKMELVRPYIIFAPVGYSDFETCEFVEHLEMSKAMTKYDSSIYMICNIPLPLLNGYLFLNSKISIGHQHDMHILKRMKNSEITEKFRIHSETCKHEYITVLRPYNKMTNIEHCQKYHETHMPLIKNDLAIVQSTTQDFPPTPPDPSLRRKIIHDFCKATSPSMFEEAGCAVCGSLILQSDLSELSSLDIDLSVLNAAGQGFTRKERKFSTEPITELDGNVIDTSCHYICVSCKEKVRHGKTPKFALARGLWLGEIPEELQQLSFAEKLLVGRVRHNRCVVRVGKGMHKMIANAVMFEHPMQKIYSVLPPPIKEMDEVLAFIFTGPCQPTEDDFHRIPLLVCRNKVAKALEWLKLNHRDYADLEISYKNLESYPEDSPPVVINYRHSATNKIPEATSVHDMELEHGTEEGGCPFTVHTLTSEEYDTTSSETLKAMAAKHLDDGGKVLAIGHSKEPQSIWRNPKLYPQMFPWLFPYGLGGIGHERRTLH